MLLFPRIVPLAAEAAARRPPHRANGAELEPVFVPFPGIGEGRSNNQRERIWRVVRRWTRVAGCVPDGRVVLMRVAARWRHPAPSGAGSRWGERRYLKVERLEEPFEPAVEAAQEA
jgi:hypothetical protein